jgi:hypothetical protein
MGMGNARVKLRTDIFDGLRKLSSEFFLSAWLVEFAEVERSQVGPVEVL